MRPQGCGLKLQAQEEEGGLVKLTQHKGIVSSVVGTSSGTQQGFYGG